MKAYTLEKFSQNPYEVFKLRELPTPQVSATQVLIQSEAFGLNFADVVARIGQYKPCPPLPAVLGYEVVGKIIEIGSEVKKNSSSLKVGDRVVALTRFGGYGEFAVADYRTVFSISQNIEASTACALATQYATAHYASCFAVRLLRNEKVLIHAGAGGVGIALIQSALHQGCEVYATASSVAKRDFLLTLGVHQVLSYEDFESKLRSQKINLDCVFDSLGASNFKKSRNLLNAGGRLVAYGASSMTDAKNLFSKVKSGLEFGIYHPAQWIMPSYSLIGVNLLEIGDRRPELLCQVMKEVLNLHEQGVYRPVAAKSFKAEELSEAHAFLQSRQSIGKIVCKW